MKTNTAFQRALVSLSHPIAIGASIVLLLNDHWWRYATPSWLTGKIGDFAWLIFAPFLLAAILAWFMPKRVALVGRASMITTGLVFALVKTDPTFHAGFAYLFNQLLGWVPATVLDPTDLLALPVLLIAWHIWRQSTISFTFHSWRGWSMLSLGALLTIANVSPIVDLGVLCLVKQDSSIAAIAYGPGDTQPFVSDDGGLTWRTESPGTVECPDIYRPYRVGDYVDVPWQITNPTNDAILYRFTRGVAIDSSRDGGRTWQPEFNLGGEEARLSFIQRTLYTLDVGPFDAMLHSPGGNLVVAMGREGVLVRTTQGEWHWVTVGPYSVPELNRFDQILSLLNGELWLAVLLVPLAVSTLTGRVRTRRLPTLMLGVAWIGWAFILLVFKPAVSYRGWFNPYPEPMSLAIGIVAVLAIMLVIRQIRVVRSESPRIIAPALMIAVIMMLVFLLPYVLWTQGAIPFYSTATLFALPLTVATLIAGFIYLRRLTTATATSDVNNFMPQNVRR